MSDLVFLTKVPDEVLQLLAGAEDCNTVGVNCNQITGFGIAGLFSALACSDLECSESAELDDLLFLETGLDFLEELIDNLVDITSIDAELVMKMLNDNGFGKFCLFHCFTPTTLLFKPSC